MKLSLFRYNRPPSDAAGVEDIDVTPVMNMFIILIPFLVSMAVFTRMAIIEFSVPPNVGAHMNNDDLPPKPKLTVRIGNDYCGIVFGESLLDSFTVVHGVFPVDTIGIQLKRRRSELSYNDEVVIASTDSVSFKNVVAIMDLCRAAGLENIGLSGATVNPDRVQ